jgi:hypothetical protein
MTEAFPVAAAIYSITRAGVRFWGYALPGQCTNAVINLTFSTGTCIAAGSWLTTRVSWATSAHAWSWVMYGGFALVVALWQRPQGSFNGWRAFMLVGFTVAVHELYWFFTYFVVHPNPLEVWFNLEVYGSFIAMCGIGIVIFCLLGFQKHLDIPVLFAGLWAFTLFYAGWAAIGYPLTLDLKIGITPLFDSGWVDFIEFCSWVLAFVVVGFSYYAKQVRARPI